MTLVLGLYQCIVESISPGSAHPHWGSLVGPRGLEPRTSSLSGMRSNRAELWALD